MKLDAATLHGAPVVSVVMPVWNCARYLEEAIASVLGQTSHDFELVIVDDGSEDASHEIIERHAQADARIRPIYRARQGLVPTLNAGCAAARGRYIARLDADDVALPERLERQVAVLESRPEVALVASSFQCINASSERRPIVINPPTEHAAIRDLLMRTNCFSHSTVMMRADVLARLGGYRSVCAEAEDYDLWTRFADSHELASIPDVLVLYRIHSAQVSLVRLEQQAIVAMAIAAAAKARRATGTDPIAGWDAIDRAAVRSLDISDDEMDEHIVRTYLRHLGTLPALGLSRAALPVLRGVMARASLLDEAAAVSSS